MFIVLLRFSSNKEKARELMTGHNAWLARGMADGVFLLAGSLIPHAGGVILAHNAARSELEARINQDPFVEHGVVSAEVLEFSGSKADPRLAFLVGGA